MFHETWVWSKGRYKYKETGKRSNTGNNIWLLKVDLNDFLYKMALEDGNHKIKSVCPNSDRLA